MTYAPADLLAVQRYLQAETGQAWSSLGIIHSTPQGGGYHEGEDLLIAADRAPGPQYPGSDYSYTDSRRDLLPNGRLAGGDAASGFDAGGGFPRFLEFNAWMRQRMLAGDPRTADIREMIHTLDRRTVRRIDRTGKQPDGGDSSHLTHTHFSFFRDSLGRRDRDDNFLGLLREFFDGKTTTEVDDMAALDDIWKALNELRAIARMTHWRWTPSRADWDKAGGEQLFPGVYGQIGGGSFVGALNQVVADVAAVKTTDAAQTTAITALADLLGKALSGGGTGTALDTAAVVGAVAAKIDEATAAESATIKALQQQVADLNAKLSAAGGALAGGAKATGPDRPAPTT